MPKAKAVADDGRRRRPAAGGYARGDETRARIIVAALEVFGSNGFDGTSTRMLAERAGVTLPALHYYFDSKEGVYLACADHIADRMRARLGATSGRIAQALARETPSLTRRFEMLLELLDEFVDLFLGEHELEKWVLFIIREQAQPTKAFDILFERMMLRVIDASTELIAPLLDRPQTSPEVRLNALALFGRIIFFRTAREAALRVLHWPDFDGRRLAVVKNLIHAQAAAEFGVAAKSKRRSRS